MARSLMYTRNTTRGGVLAALGLLLATGTSAGSGFGEPASEEDVRRVYLSTAPDGENLPAGSGTAKSGKPLYDVHCAACHGFDGEGGIANQLVGGFGTLDSEQPVRTIGSFWPYATTIFDYVRRSMPFAAPMSLRNDEYYAITAYLLNMNGIIEDDFVVDRESLPAVKMPNRDGFVNAWPERPAEYELSE